MLPLSRSIRTVGTIVLQTIAFTGKPACDSYGQARDSSGVAVVENDRAVWAEAREWRISDEPTVSIGTAYGPDEYALYRVTGSARLSDGRIAVASSGMKELRVYDDSGRFLSKVGGEGSGPGEFGRLTFLRAVGRDTLMVWDHDLRRVSVFDGQVSFVRSYSPTPLHGRPVVVGDFAPLSDGTTLFATFSLRSSLATAHVGLSRDPTYLLWCDDGGELIDTVLVFPGGEFYSSEEFPRIEVPFARRSFVRVFGSGFYVGDNARYEISYHRPDGSTLRVVRKAHEPAEVTGRVFEREKREWVESVESPEVRLSMSRMYEPVKGPPTMPAFSQFLTDVEGNLWVQEYQPFSDDNRSWTVFTPSGVMLGSVTLPARFTLHEVGPDYVLGKQRDEMDTEYVQLYELVKP